MNTADQGYEVAKRVRAAKSWLVRCGTNVVGPVSIELIERGIEAGKIPLDAEMAFGGGGEWRSVAEIFGVPAPRPAPPVQLATIVPFPIPTAPVSVRYADDPINIPKQGMVASLFG